MFCDASKEGYGGYLEFNQSMEEDNLSIEKKTSKHSHLSPDVESVSRMNVVTNENIDKKARRLKAPHMNGVRLVDRVFYPEVETIIDGKSRVRSPEADLRVSIELEHDIE